MDGLISVWNKPARWIFFLAGIQLLFVIGAFFFDHLLFMFIPVSFAVLLLLLKDIRLVFLLFALVIPFSLEVSVTGDLSTDLPSEQIMWLLTGIGIFYFAGNPTTHKSRQRVQLLTVLVIAHMMWLGLTVLLSHDVIISLKFFLAKTWYIVPFYFLFMAVFTSSREVHLFFKVLSISMTLAIVIVMIRHGLSGFTFRSINEAVHPIFRNHVNYACMLVLLVPYVWAIYRNKKSGWWLSVLLLYLGAIYLSYTRAALVALLIGVISYFVVRAKLAKPAIIIVLIGLTFTIPYFLIQNRYLDLAPEYERAIAHYKFEDLIEATYKFEDISTMERLYRWVAGKQMIAEHPVFGFGPATFYSHYRDYTLSEFQTYVSNNPEKSGIHNYYLMTMVEQGIPGFLIFLGLVIAGIIYGEKYYHKAISSQEKLQVMASVVSLIIISSILIINDMVEADKVGPFFFIALAIISNYRFPGNLDTGS